MKRFLPAIFAIGILFMVGLTGVLLVRSLTAKNPQAATSYNQNAAQISGVFDINGVIPPETTITISRRIYASGANFEPILTNISAKDSASWVVSNNLLGATYELEATLYEGSTPIATSSALPVSAPATDNTLTLNIQNSEDSGASSKVNISGTVKINGYIPTGATISVIAKSSSTSASLTLADGVGARVTQTFSYDQADSDQNYNITAYLYDSSKKQIGVSSVLNVTAPAANETLTINSSAQASTTPVPTRSLQNQTTQASSSSQISGSISFNGVAPANSRIVIFEKVYNASSYQVAVDNLNPVNATSWDWKSANGSTWYDIFAVLKQKQSSGTDKDIAASAVISVAAPTVNQILVVNSSIAIPAPSNPPSVNCGTFNVNYWNAAITLPAITDAKSYWYQVGTYSGGNNVTDQVINASGTGDQTVNVQIGPNTLYYFRYSYANVANVSGSSSQFAPFSPANQTNCGG